MKLIKLGIISLVFFFLLITGISLLIPSHIRISRAININADKDSVMMLVKNPTNWKKWYPGLDSAEPLIVNGEIKGMILDNKDPAHPVGLTLTNIADSEVTAQFGGKRMKPVTNVWRAIAYPGRDSITLQWYMDFHLRWYPWEKFSSLLLEKSYGSKMEQGLFNLNKQFQSPIIRPKTD